MRKYFLFIVVAILSLTASAQFTIRPAASRLSTKTDTVARITSDTPGGLNLTLYNEAYDEFLRRERFKQRNKINFRSSLTINHTSYDNWAAGGNNSFTGRIWINFEHTYTMPNFNVKSTFEGAYALLVTDEKARKNEDLLYLSSTPSWRLGPKWEVSGSVVLKSQFTNSYTAPGDTILASSFLSPATLTLSAGISYAPPKKRLNIYVAPLSGNLLMVTNKELADKGGFGMDKGKQFKPEFGVFFRLTYKESFWKELMTFETKLESFWKYSFSDMPTLWWENKLSFKITEIFGAKLYLLTIYNDKITTPRAVDSNYWQINESAGFGLTFNLKSKENVALPENKITKGRLKRK